MRIVADTSIEGLRGDSVSDADIVSVNEAITEASLEMIEGQHLDVAFEGRSDIGMDGYLDMISRKTGALIRTPMHVGAIMGTHDQAVIESFRECGRSLGYVFQIRDDVLGIWSEEKTTGKPVGADVRRKKNSLPIVHAMSQADRVQRRVLEHVYEKETVEDADVDSVLEIMDTLGTEAFANSLAAEHCERGLEQLAGIEIPSYARDDIEELSDLPPHTPALTHHLGIAKRRENSPNQSPIGDCGSINPSCLSSAQRSPGMGCPAMRKFSSTSETDRGPGIVAATAGCIRPNCSAAAFRGTTYLSQTALILRAVSINLDRCALVIVGRSRTQVRR